MPARHTDNPTERELGASLTSSVLDHLHEGCQVVDRDFRYVYVNEAVASHGRTTREALLGKRMGDVYPGIEGTEMFALLRRCMRERSSARMENEFTYADGSTAWFELRMQPVPQGICILSLDISERKARELELGRALRSLTTLSQCNQALVRSASEEQLLQDVCRILVHEAGYGATWVGFKDGPHSPTLNARASTFDSLEDAAAMIDDADAQAFVQGALVATTPMVLHFDDSTPWQRAARERGFTVCIALSFRVGDTQIGALVVYGDRSEPIEHRELTLLAEIALDTGFGVWMLRVRQMQSETYRQLEDEQARTRAVYDHLPHGTFVWQRMASGFVLVDFNSAAATLTRGRVYQLLGKPLEQFAAIPHLEQDLGAAVHEERVIRREVTCTIPGAGRPARMALTYGPVPPDLVLLHAEDVTERRQTEEQLVASQRLEAVGSLAGGVAHDFNNLLSAILTYSAFAVEQLGEQDPVRADIEQVHEAGRRAADLTRQLLAFSRKQVLEPRVTSLNEVVTGLESMLRRLLGERIDIVVHSESDLGNVLADPGQMEQVLMNLVVNARDAMPQGGKLTIETANVDLDETYVEHHVTVSPGRYVRLCVSDAGVGMSADVRDRVFEPFFTTKEQGKGTGLGLSTVYGIIKQSGGHIWVYSEPNRGTSFKIYLPRVDAPAQQRNARSASSRPRGNETVLVVEDEPAVRRAAERILRSAGYHVLGAANAEDALELCEERKPAIDLLCTDVVMPQMSGPELAKQLRRSYPELKVLFMSGYSDGAVVNHGLLTEGTSFLGKPFAVSELARKVREVLDDDRR